MLWHTEKKEFHHSPGALVMGPPSSLLSFLRLNKPKHLYSKEATTAFRINLLGEITKSKAILLKIIEEVSQGLGTPLKREPDLSRDGNGPLHPSRKTSARL